MNWPVAVPATDTTSPPERRRRDGGRRRRHREPGSRRGRTRNGSSDAQRGAAPDHPREAGLSDGAAGAADIPAAGIAPLTFARSPAVTRPPGTACASAAAALKHRPGPNK